MNLDDVADCTFTELQNNNADDKYSINDEDAAEMRDELEDMWMMAEYTMMAVTLSRLFMADQMTFQEYIRQIEWVEKQAYDDGVSLP